jgi:hypothetical protein
LYRRQGLPADVVFEYMSENIRGIQEIADERKREREREI